MGFEIYISAYNILLHLLTAYILTYMISNWHKVDNRYLDLQIFN